MWIDTRITKTLHGTRLELTLEDLNEDGLAYSLGLFSPEQALEFVTDLSDSLLDVRCMVADILEAQRHDG